MLRYATTYARLFEYFINENKIKINIVYFINSTGNHVYYFSIIWKIYKKLKENFGDKLEIKSWNEGYLMFLYINEINQ